MKYTITIFKKRGEPLYALWIDTPDADPQPGTVWQVVQMVEFMTGEPITAVLCSLLLMSEASSDRLFRQITDSWLGVAEADPLDGYDRYASQEEAAASLDEAYLDQLESSQQQATSAPNEHRRSNRLNKPYG